MEKLNNLSIRFLVVISLTLVGLLGVIQPALAQGVVYGDTVPEGTTVSRDVILYGDNVFISGNVDGDVLVIGREVTLDGDVSGSLIVVGETVTVNGQIGGTVYAGAANLELGPEADLNRNLYFAGLSLTTQDGSVVGRDLLAASLGAQLSGEVNGSTKAIIGALEFVRLFMDTFDDSISFSQSTLMTSVLNNDNEIAPVRARASGFAAIGVTGLLRALDSSDSVIYQQSGGVDWEKVGEWSLERLRALVTLFIFGVLSIWLIPKVITESAEKLREKPLPGTGFGLLALVIAFNLLGVVLLLGVIILAIGMFLGFSTLWELAWAFMALGFFGLGLAATIFGLFVLYISKVIVAYFIGYVILNRLAPSVVRYKILSLLLGLAIYVLLVGIPTLGWVIGVLVTALGLGAAWLYYRERRALSDGEAAVVEADE